MRHPTSMSGPRSPRHRTSRPRFGVLLAAVALLGSALAATPAAAAGPPVSISVLSSPRADMISDGDALVAVQAPPGLRRQLRISVNGRDVTAAFREVGGRRIGELTGLVDGANAVSATVGVGRPPVARLTITNHPRTGPMFSGPQEQPFVCQTAGFHTLAGTALGAPTDAACSVPTKVEYVYRSTADRTLKPLADPADRPADLATTTTSTGRTVPYVVRVETGVINRSIYEFAVLDAGAGQEVSPFEPPVGWNKRMVYTFGGGCPGGWYKQGNGTGGVSDDWTLGQGYAMVSSSLNVFGNNCQPVTAAETMAMTKEHVVESIGVPQLTLGIGCSGGSYQVFGIGDNYPGLLDGILAGCVFPEVDFASLHTITDARLLQVYFGSSSGFTDEQKRAIAGFGKVGTINNLGEAGRRIDPRVFCPAELPVAQRYDPVGNPTGARCDVYSHQLNIFGPVPGSAGRIPLRPLDNVGIQYGLDALNSGAISVGQFLDLNARIGGFDRDANVVPQRTVADRAAVDTSYRTGQLTNGSRLGSLPIIELREYTDELANGDIHLRFHSFSFRQRLIDANGDADNHVMWTESTGNGGFSSANAKYRDAVVQLDNWVSTVKHRQPTSGTALPSHRTVVAAKPRAAADACWSPAGVKVSEPQVPGVRNTVCNNWYPVWPSPRMVAGGPMANDVIACTRKPVSGSDYPVPFTADQLAQLQSIFPSGVCDWSAPGVGQTGSPSQNWPAFGS